MKVFESNEMKGGWFIGDFEPTLFSTDLFEVAFKKFHKDEHHGKHYHKIATEYNYLTKGSLIINGTKVEAGQIFVLAPLEVADPVFLEDCEMVVVKIPSVKGDKYDV